MTRTREQEIALEIGNNLIKTLSSMPSEKADRIVKEQAERLINELGGVKGKIKTSYSCILFKDGHSSGCPDAIFVEE